MTKQIPLTNGGAALVDDADFEWLSQYTWSNDGHNHAQGFVNGRAVQMHQLLIECPPGLDIDHKNVNGLDNRRENLRVATRSQNMANRRKYRTGGHSQYKGVTFVKRGRRPWQAQIGVNGKNMYLGVFQTEDEAALRYDMAAREHFGEFANLNFA